MFKDKVVVVTGSTQGIGKRISEKLAERDAKIVINSRNSQAVEDVVSEFKARNQQAIGFAGDISDHKSCKNLRDFVIEEYGRIDYLINNAAISTKGTLIDSTAETIEKAFSINLLGALYASKAMVEDINKNKGGILFISSLAGIIGLPSYLPYSATKRALISITESLKIELADNDVFVGINFPGFTENNDHKEVILGNGQRHTLQKRPKAIVVPRDQTVSKIIRQIEKRKFKSYSSYHGYIIQLIYRFAPSFSLWLIQRNRNQIIHMDNYPQRPIIRKRKN